MSSPMVSRWPVVLALNLGPQDADGDGLLTDAAAERLLAVARDAFFDLCGTVDRSSIDVRSTSVRRGAAVESNTVSCSLSPGAEVPRNMRDEFIALAHAASHFH